MISIPIDYLTFSIAHLAQVVNGSCLLPLLRP